MLIKGNGYSEFVFQTGDDEFDKANQSQLTATHTELCAALNKLAVVDKMFKLVLEERARMQKELVTKLAQ